MKQILYFSAAWCGPCKTIKPIIDEFSTEFGLDVTKVDIETQHSLTNKYKIISIPTILFIEDGTVVDKIVGAKAKQFIKEKFSNFSKN